MRKQRSGGFWHFIRARIENLQLLVTFITADLMPWHTYCFLNAEYEGCNSRRELLTANPALIHLPPAFDGKRQRGEMPFGIVNF